MKVEKEEKKPKYCPLRLGPPVPAGQELDLGPAVCWGERCGWWHVEDYGEGGMQSGCSVEFIADAVTFIAYEDEDEQPQDNGDDPDGGPGPDDDTDKDRSDDLDGDGKRIIHLGADQGGRA